ncbi:hypothetical protein BS50DRAFT_634058 [Corynespora cassiicola Philippines]|uniref:MARVEL domain-containing protein n=1 Tax=Corynespora cassiicola Philippines TaxID=1448308 RepID=A0A2T2NSV8_CORCC|nr:hypothetical protein BS50DRAFT_634058 [Corynespora cassiicola Philippines]
MAVNWVLPMRGVQAALSVVVLGLMGYVSSWWATHWRQMAPVEVIFIIFASVISIIASSALLIVPWKMARVAEQTAPKLALISFEMFTMFCWFGGFVALAVFLSDRICFGTVCSVAKAGTALSAFTWLLWAVTAVFSVIGLFKGGRGSAKGTNEPKVEMHQGV